LKRRGEERVLHLQNPLPKMTKLMPVRRTEGILATAAAAAAMLKKVLNKKRVPQRLISLLNVAETFALRGPCVHL
jgi:hypothetical protein